MAAPSVVQHAKATNTGFVTLPIVTLGSTPTFGTGNVLLAVVSGVPFGTPTWGNGWTLEQSQAAAFGTSIYLLYRYVQSGDTTSVPNPCSNGLSFLAPSIVVYEIGGISGTWAADKDQSGSAVKSGNTPSINSLTTNNANELAVMGISQDAGGSAAPTWSAGWSVDESGAASGSLMAYGTASEVFSASGSTVSATITFTASSVVTSRYAIVLLNGASTTYSASVAEAASAADTVSASQTSPAAIAEAASAADTVSSTAVLASAILEAADAQDAVSTLGSTYAVDISESAAAHDVVHVGTCYLVFIDEYANAQDGVAGSVVPPPPAAVGARFRPNVVDPRYLSIEQWTAFVAESLLPIGDVPRWTDEDGWRQWAQLVRQLPALAPLGIPDPRSGFTTWQEWGYRLNESLLLL